MAFAVGGDGVISITAFNVGISNQAVMAFTANWNAPMVDDLISDYVSNFFGVEQIRSEEH